MFLSNQVLDQVVEERTNQTVNGQLNQRLNYRLRILEEITTCKDCGRKTFIPKPAPFHSSA